MKTILITWWLGYIWSHTVVAFIQAWYNVVILDNLCNTKREVLDRIQDITWERPVFYEGDIRDNSLLEKIFTENQIEWVIHFAALKAVGESCKNPFLYYNNNIDGTLALLETMQKHQTKKIIFSSSATVYDASKSNPPFNEDAPLGTTNPYGTTKLIIEQILKDLSNSWLQSICLRYFNPVWAHSSWLLGEDPNGIPNNLVPYIYQVASGQLPHLRVFGDDYPTPDGTWIRDYLHVMDLANAHLLAYQKNIEKPFEVINLGTGNGTSVLEMINIVQKATEKQIPYKIYPRRDWDIAISLADPSKANNLLWRKAKLSIEDAIRDGRNFIQKQ